MKNLKGIDECINILRNSNSTNERKGAIERLLDMGVEASGALSELMKIVNGRDDFILQGLAEEAIVKIGKPSIPILKELIKSFLVKKRIKILSLLGDIALDDNKVIEDVLGIIIPIARSDISSQVRLHILTIIEKFIVKNRKSPKIIELLGEILRNDRNSQIQYEASQTLVKAKSQLAANELIKSLDRTNYPVLRFTSNPRIYAAQALQLVSIEESKLLKGSIPLFLKIFREDSNTTIRTCMVFPLLYTGGWDMFIELLQITVKERNWEVRMNTLEYAGHFEVRNSTKEHAKKIIPILKKIAREDKMEAVRNEAKDLLEEFEESSNED